ncbi:MAG: T9SS type A sorting domain-containing protein [Bacteroidota bacterium]
MDQDMYISQFDEFQYRFECAVPIGSGASTQIGQHVEINQNGFIFVAGLFEGTVDFGLGGGNGVLTNVGQTFPDNDDQADIFIARYFPTNNCPITDVEDPIIGLGVTTFPNPTNGPWSVELDQVYPTINLKVLDLTGRALLEQNYQTVERIDLALDLPQGLYFVELSSLEERITLKLIME